MELESPGLSPSVISPGILSGRYSNLAINRKDITNVKIENFGR